MNFTAELWEWEGKAAWVFVTVPADVSADIREMPRLPRGFGSVRVQVALGGSRWRTSVFPQSKEGTYLLPVKRAVRDAEGVEVGDLVTIDLEPLE
jgi:hypothetical protein